MEVILADIRPLTSQLRQEIIASNIQLEPSTNNFRAHVG
jgi:hypothetical protein